MDSPYPMAKRNRSQLSCSNCRVSKSKCDRTQPCSQCVKKDRASMCQIPLPVARKKPVVSMQKRLRHLESMVKDIMTPPEGLPTPSARVVEGAARSFRQTPSHSTTPNHQNDSFNGGTKEHTNPGRASGQVFLEANESKYIGSSHWAAILENIEEVKNYFEEIEEDEDEELNSDKDEIMSVSALAFNTAPANSITEILARLPARPVADRLVSSFFNSNSPSLNIIHGPSFQREYQRFWIEPEAFSLSWLGLIFSMMTLSSLSINSVGEAHPDSRSSAREMIQLYRSCCVQCLVLSNFTKPGPHTIETLLLHMEGELILNKANPVSFYLLAGNTVRLALRMGLHRDPSKVRSNISVFQAEMRRRLWNQIVQAELLSSFQIELPGMISNIDSDTLSPRNLRDTDFDETSADLPQSRPNTDVTPVSYAIWKGKICRISGQISALANRLQLPDYSKVMGLDHEISEAYSTIPSQFLQVLPTISITDLPDAIIKRLSLALIFHKSRCMLHRRYLTEPKGCGEFDFSKTTAIDTSMEVLRLQALVHDAFLPGGPLCRDRWFLSALSMHDFLVSGMIVYLSLVQSLDKVSFGSSSPFLNDEKSQKIRLLKQSYEIWTHTDNISAEMKRASKLIATLLQKLNIGDVKNPEEPKSAHNNELFTAGSNGSSLAGLSISNYPPNMYKSTGTPHVNLDGTWFEGEANASVPIHETNDSVKPTASQLSSRSMLTFSDNFDWQSFDDEFPLAYPFDVDWNTLRPEDLLMGPEGNYF